MTDKKKQETLVTKLANKPPTSPGLFEHGLVYKAHEFHDSAPLGKKEKLRGKKIS